MSTLDDLSGPPVFVVGNARSGTTWVFDILESHPEVAGVFESWLFARLGVGGILEDLHWDDQRLERARQTVGRTAGPSQLVTRDEVVRDLRPIVSGWLAGALEPHHRFLVEKTPAHLHAVTAITTIFPKARFVEVVRDGRDTALSVIAAQQGWNPNILGGGSGTRDAATDWRVSIETGLRASAALGERWLQVRYEELRRDFDATVRTLFAFAGAPCSDACLAEVRAATDLRRYPTSEEGFRRAGRVGDWRRQMSVIDALRFERVAGNALRRHGYAESRWWWMRHALSRTPAGRRHAKPRQVDAR